MPYRIVLMTYLHNINPSLKVSILTQLTTTQMEELLLDEVLNYEQIHCLWKRITSRMYLIKEQNIYVQMLERVSFRKRDYITYNCLEGS